MSFHQHVNEVDCTKEPTPTDEYERKEHDDVYGFFTLEEFKELVTNNAW